MLTIRISEELEARLNDLAKFTGQTKTFHVRETILKNFDDLESFYLAKKSSADIKLNTAKPKF